METFGVMVGFSDRRPIVPDEGHRFVVVAARHGREAELVAAQIVGGGVEMVTSTRIVWAEV